MRPPFRYRMRHASGFIWAGIRATYRGFAFLFIGWEAFKRPRLRYGIAAPAAEVDGTEPDNSLRDAQSISLIAKQGFERPSKYQQNRRTVAWAQVFVDGGTQTEERRQ